MVGRSPESPTMLAFAHHVADVAEHEQIAGHRARQARDIVGIAGDETSGKTFGKMRTRIRFRHRIADALRQLRADGDALVRASSAKLLAGRHRRPPAPPRYSRDQRWCIPKGRIKPDIGQFRRVVLRPQKRKGVARLRRNLHERRRADSHTRQDTREAKPIRVRLIPKSPMFLLFPTWCAVFWTQRPRRKKGFSGRQDCVEFA